MPDDLICPENEVWSDWHAEPKRLTWHCEDCGIEWVIPASHTLDEGGVCPQCEAWILILPVVEVAA